MQLASNAAAGSQSFNGGGGGIGGSGKWNKIQSIFRC